MARRRAWWVLVSLRTLTPGSTTQRSSSLKDRGRVKRGLTGSGGWVGVRDGRLLRPAAATAWARARDSVRTAVGPAGGGARARRSRPLLPAAERLCCLSQTSVL